MYYIGLNNVHRYALVQSKPLCTTESKTKLQKKIVKSGDMGHLHDGVTPSKNYYQGHQNQRKISFQGRYGRSNIFSTRSQSLDAIIEELYYSGTEENIHDIDRENYFEVKKPLIPRIKLRRSVSCLKVESNYKKPFEMSTNPKTLQDTEEGFQNYSAPDSSVTPIEKYKNLNITKNTDENYFVKNFDECIKRLQVIENEHENMENDSKEIHFQNIQSENMKSMEDELSQAERIEVFEMLPDQTIKNTDSDSDKENTCEKIKPDSKIFCPRHSENSTNFNFIQNENHTNMSMEPTTQKTDNSCKESNETIAEWYSNLKQQFENTDQKNEEQKFKEMSCRIMGATLKNSCEAKKPEDIEKDTKHYFSRLVKSNKSLIDEELPDPDKVKNIRAMFQENLNSTLKKNLAKNLGGSLQNITNRATEQQIIRPLSAQCNRNDIAAVMRDNQMPKDLNETKCGAQISNLVKDLESLNKVTVKKINHEKDLRIGKDFKNRKFFQPKWTDTGSVSSGISSDLSSYDTDVESFSRELMEPEQDEIFVSDDDLLEDVKHKNYVQNEILEKIRSFGTSVTYYGGEMITCSVGPLLSPTTQAILEEIGEKYASEDNSTRSFEEFYRKYFEANEPNRKKKLGRTRSFGQNDVFQKPNVLNNTEIELYKNDLELEIGIRKPAGISQNSLKKKVTKSNSLGSQSEKGEKKPPETDLSDFEKNNQSFIEEKIKPITESTKAQKNELKDDEFTELNVKNTSNFEDVFKISSSTKDNEVTFNEKTENEETKIHLQVQNDINKPSSKLLRCVSAPGYIKDDKIEFKNEELVKNSENLPNEILFGYEKKLLNTKKPDNDMKFEEFEVCETVSEKLEKLQEKNLELKNVDSVDELESENKNVINEELSKDSQTIITDNSEVLPITECNNNINEGNENKKEDYTKVKRFDNENQTDQILNFVGKAKQLENETWENKTFREDTKNGHEKTFILKNECLYPDKKYEKYGNSKWPIETSVMADIQKNDELTPKIVTNGKPLAKTKIKLF